MPKDPTVSVARSVPKAGTAQHSSWVAVPPRRYRIDSIDLLRGLAIVIMALDHVRDFFTNVRFNPLDLSQTTPLLFLTRWVTHQCAPVFVFLAGTGAFLYLTKGRTTSDLAKFLFSRGIWLIFLEFTVIRFAWLMNFDYSFAFVQVIWVIGWSMVALSGLVFLPRGLLGVISIGMVAVHNLADPITPGTFGSFGWLWQFLHVQGPIAWDDGNVLLVIYPLIPWIGVMGAGYLFGSILLHEDTARRRKLYTLGFILMACFLFFRALNVYGDPHPWAVQNTPVMTFLSFINTEKYPPSLLYLMMTLGPAIALLPFLERWEGKVADFIIVFGRVPLFFYVVHLFLIHVLALVYARHTLGTFRFLVTNTLPDAFPPSYGFSLPFIYVIWIGVVFALYFPCKWYAAAKRKSKNPLLSYL